MVITQGEPSAFRTLAVGDGISLRAFSSRLREAAFWMVIEERTDEHELQVYIDRMCHAQYGQSIS